MRKSSLVHLAVASLVAGGCGGTSEPDDSRRKPLTIVQRSAEASFGVEELFNWAERQYPQFFPGHKETQEYEQYQFRFYPESDNYVGVAGRTVSVLGKFTGGEIVDVGTIGEFECVVAPPACPAYEPPRLSIGFGPIVGRRSDGTWIAFGDESKLAKDHALFGATGTLELGVDAKQIVLGRDLAILVAPGGIAYGWGYSGWAFGASLNVPISFQNRIQIAFPGAVRQAGTAMDGAALRTFALLDDGTVWTFPGAGTGTANPRPAKVDAPDDLASLSRAPLTSLGTLSGVYGVTRAGAVWRIPLSNREAPRQLPVDQVKQIDCVPWPGDQCFGARHDGSVVAWLAPGGLTGGGDNSLGVDQPHVVPGISGATHAAASGTDILVLTASGAVWKWAPDYSYIFDAQGNRTPYLKDPERLSISDATDLACGEVGCYVRRANGTLVRIRSSGELTSAGLPRLP